MFAWLIPSRSAISAVPTRSALSTSGLTKPQSTPCLRLQGEARQLKIYDLVLIVVLANAVQNAMVGDDTTLVGGLVTAVTLPVLISAFTPVLARSSRVEHAMVGEPLMLVEHGRLVGEEPVPG